jgi:hypothetical protein
MQDDKILKAIEKCLDWYGEFGGTTTIELLLDLQDRLALLSVNLAEIVAVSKGSYLRVYFQRKFVFSTKKLTFIKDGEKIGTADEKARVQIGDIKEVEIQEEEYADLLNLKMRQINRVLQAIQQRISYQKQEKQSLVRMSHDNKQL